MSQENQEQGKEAQKVLKSFDQVIHKLTAVVKGTDNLKVSKKIPKEATQSLVEELFAEEHKEIATQVKEELKSLLKGYVTLNNELNNERKKLDGIELAKKKEFTSTANKLFAKIEGIDDLVKDYFGAFKEAEKAVNEGEKQSED